MPQGRRYACYILAPYKTTFVVYFTLERMAQVLRPSPKRSLPIRVLVSCVALAGVAVALLPMLRGGISVGGLLDAAGILVIAVIPLAALLLEDKRLRSIELSEMGATSLVWSRVDSFPFIRLTRLEIPWTQVKRVGVRGLAIVIVGETRAIHVNTYLFPDHKVAFDFINERFTKVTRGPNAL